MRREADPGWPAQTGLEVAVKTGRVERGDDERLA
jgi:hypothetical protein